MAERLLLFRYKDEILGLPASLSREVIELGRVVPLPGGRGGLAGLVISSGQARPLVDLHLLAGLPHHEVSLGLVAQVGGDHLVFPMDEVVGNASSEGFKFADVISAPQQPVDHQVQHWVRVINPELLLAKLQSRMMPV